MTSQNDILHKHPQLDKISPAAAHSLKVDLGDAVHWNSGAMYEADLNRVLAGRNFDFNRDVVSVYLYRWGHSMVYPKPGWPFSAPITASNGQITRVPSARFYARQQIGRISFGAQDVESSPANESAIGAGVRTSGEVLPLL